MASITLKQGDTTPEFTATLEDPAQELTGNETIRFYMEGPSGPNQQHGELIVNAEIPNSEVDYQTNEVTYDFSAGETSRLDDNLAEIVVTYPDGEVQTFPDSGYHTITIEEPVNRDAPPADLSDPDITVGVVNADQVNAPTLQAVETLTGSITGSKTLKNIAGANLDIDANGNLNAVSGQDSPSHYNPIYDSDEDGIIDADVDSDVVQSGEVSVTHNGSPAITEEVVFAVDDTDTTTPLSIDTGSLGATYDELQVVGRVGGHQTSTEGFSPIKITLNNNTTADGSYGYNYIQDGTIGSASGNGYWAEEMYDGYEARIKWIIDSGDSLGSNPRAPSIRSLSSSHNSAKTLVDGLLNKRGELPADSIQITTDFPAVAKIRIIGVSY